MKEAKEFELLRGQIIPRRTHLICAWQFTVAIVLGVLIAVFIHRLPLAGTAVNELSTVGLTFASIALSGCFTTTVLAITLPGQDRIRRWARIESPIHEGSSVYLDLVFVIIWAAICQLILIAVCVLALLFGGGNPIWHAAAPFWQRLTVFVTSFVFFYALNELFTVIQTLFRISYVLMYEEGVSDTKSSSDAVIRTE